MITKIAISGYRSLRDVRIGLKSLNVVTGANGSGKSSLYRALRLLADIAQGRIIQSLAAEGGLHSTLWAGPESFARSVKRGEQPVQGTVRKARLSLKLGFPATTTVTPSTSDCRSRRARNSPAARKSRSRANRSAKRSAAPTCSRCVTGPPCAFESGEWRQVFHRLAPFDTMMTHCGDPREAPELLFLRERMRDWLRCCPRGRRP